MSVTASLNYFVPPADGSRPWNNINKSYNGASDDTLSDEERGRNWKTAVHQVEIRNLRGQEGSVSLDKEGFQFLKHASKEKGFNTDDLQDYYEESIELVKKATGASRAVIFDHSTPLLTFGLIPF
jgi:hypothetical protein